MFVHYRVTLKIHLQLTLEKGDVSQNPVIYKPFWKIIFNWFHFCYGENWLSSFAEILKKN